MKKIIICAICAICGFTTANAQAKFGHVNTQEIIQAMPEYQKAQTEIKALQDQYEADLKSMQDELQKKGEASTRSRLRCPRISSSVVSRSFRICTRRSSRASMITSRLSRRPLARRCRPFRPRCSMPSRPSVPQVVMSTSWRTIRCLTSAQRSLLMSLLRSKQSLD